MVSSISIESSSADFSDLAKLFGEVILAVEFPESDLLPSLSEAMERINTVDLARSLLSNDCADQVIVTIIQKLGQPLDATSKGHKQRTKRVQRSVFLSLN